MKQIVIAVLTIFFLCNNAFAQQSINSAGGNYTGTGGSVSFSVGQLTYTTNSGSGGTVYQGVHIPYEILVITSQKDIPDINIEISAFPNPVTDNLVLKIGNTKVNSYKAVLFNLKGELIGNLEITGNETILNMQKYLPSVYFLKISEGENTVKTFKIIKK